jgi:ataxia telangiectasia mutated family protein
MYEAYSNVEDPDGFYGIRHSDVFTGLDRKLRHEGDHLRSLRLHSAQLSNHGSHSNDYQAALDVMRDLHDLGLDPVGKRSFGAIRDSSTIATSAASEPLLFELAWRTSDWDLPVVRGSNASAESLFYSSLRAVHRERNLAVAQQAVSSAVEHHFGVLKDSGAQKIAQVKTTVGDLICLREIQKWLNPTLQAGLDAGDLDLPALQQFITLDAAFPFADAQKIFATRRSLISAAREREAQTLFGDLGSPRLEFLNKLEMKCLLRLGQMARAEGNEEAAIDTLCALRKLDRGMSAELQEELGELLWAQGEQLLAVQHLKTLQRASRSDRHLDRSKEAVILSRMVSLFDRAMTAGS